MNKQPWFKVNEIVSLSLYGYDSIYRVTKIIDLPNGRSNIKQYGYKLIKCSDNSPLTYGESKLSTFNESLLLKCPQLSYMTWCELKQKLNNTNFLLEEGDE